MTAARGAIRTDAEALAFVREHGLVTLTRAGDLPCFVEEVTGGPVKGSWWGHAHGTLIFNLAENLGASPEILVAKVASGKVTFVHAALWPAIYRVVSDPEWRGVQMRNLKPAAQSLLARVESVPVLHVEATDRAAAKELEKKLLVLASSVHTASGRHETELRTWRSWASPELEQEAQAITLPEARKALAAAGPPLSTGTESRS